MKTPKITLIPGDGIGPEVTSATCKIIEAAGVKVEWEVCEAGAAVFKKGLPSGVPTETIESIKRNRIALKGPLETPVGYGEKSANVTLRKLFETFANIRPIREFPGVKSPYAGRKIDFVIVRENVEDLYAGIEYMQTPGTAQTLKIITKKGCEKIVRLAFEYARSEGRKSVHCATKANIMKFSEGTLKRTFEEIAPEYPEINAQHIIVDNCAHQLVRFPEKFETIVTTNMNGDILSDLGSGLIGGLGFAPGANIGNDIAIFEAVHGSAPKYAGKNTINPTAVILSGVMMLRYLDLQDIADKVEQAVLVTLKEGKVLTRDIIGDEKAATTSQFTDEIIKNLGRTIDWWPKRQYKKLQVPKISSAPDYTKAKSRQVVGVDVFVESPMDSESLGKNLELLSEGTPFKLKMISNRGVVVYPSSGVSPDVVDHWRCRFMLKEETANLNDDLLLPLLKKIGDQHTWAHLEKLNVFDGKNGFSRDQGEN
ncbi:NADP-dependent isocitrate dehydrogenase [Candidatus Nucleicultrix amoebiphila]|jgi:isocitrate dehydrogenase|uniref:Isocitrate dehydrogenase [NADP] n=1 Tax=Candidatus Nucleicultrix amoebiphila FS5 TaxID=1414854 RepID=A0A1W6N4M4_9PROT|nr:NADP-dependent isocitrate dehydrogenase [Candidatus Nucleicultrix amoebiphila]ARN84729.1 isocitrate dehydrogenase [Candidatus Nucleicultrix amoebiphila FS5]